MNGTNFHLYLNKQLLNNLKLQVTRERISNGKIKLDILLNLNFYFIKIKIIK